MPLLFAVTLFVSAFLLFLVQPMIGKMILPSLGGTPAVWNTCMVFFQTALLAGYFYTHSVSTYLPTRRQVVLQCVLLVVPLIVLPFGLGAWQPPAESNPIFSVLWILLLVVGLPFFVVATSAPLLQKWFSHTGHPSSKDPYFLYAASNLGSLLALVLYPTFIEPFSTVPNQAWLWTVAYAVFIGLTVACAAAVWLSRPAPALAADALALGAPSALAADTSTAIAAGRPAGAATVQRAAATAEKTTAVHAGKPPRKKRRSISAPIAPAAKTHEPTQPREERVTIWRRLRWIGLAAAPSSIMLGVTTYLTTDIAAIPLFWVVPLILYLLTFILVFMRWPVEWTGRPHTIVVAIQPLFVLLQVVTMLSWLSLSTLNSFLLHLMIFFTTALLCHGELAKDRPSTKYLTEFYLCMSLGGMLGGMFNALVAPVLFKTLIEYPLAVIFACLLRPPTHFLHRFFYPKEKPPESTSQDYMLDVGYAFCVGLLLFAITRLVKAPNFWPEPTSTMLSWLQASFYDSWRNPQFPRYLDYLDNPGGKQLDWSVWNGSARSWAILVEGVFTAGIPVLICLIFAGRPLRFGLSLLALLVVYSINEAREDSSGSQIVYRHRGFFGPLSVREDRERINPGESPPRYVTKYITLIHGGIDHGRQLADPELRDTPITYFHPTGGIGQIFSAFREVKHPTMNQVEQIPPYAIVGLGTGSLAVYSRENQVVRFYEIDPAVKELSLPSEGQKPFFHYLLDAKEKRQTDIEVILGDGRLKLKEAPDNYYQILVLDAFSSDAIPVHLLTLDALKLYVDKTADGGIIIFNITNRYVDMEPVLGDLAKELGLIALYYGDTDTDPRTGQTYEHKFSSDWVVMVKPRKDPKAIAAEVTHLFGAAPPALGPAGIPWATLARSAGGSVKAPEVIPDEDVLWYDHGPWHRQWDMPLRPINPFGWKDKGLVEDPWGEPARESQLYVSPLLLRLNFTPAYKLNDELYYSHDGWRPSRRQGAAPWTDNYSNLLSVMSWR